MKSVPFELLAARFVAISVQSVPEQLVSPIFASPLSARSPDLCMLWHTGYRKRHRVTLFVELILSVFIGCLKGFIRLVANFRPYGYALYGKINDTILVATSTCIHETPNGGYKTTYVYTETDDGMFVFGPVKNCGKNAREVTKLSFKYKFLFLYILIKSGIHAFLTVKGNLFDRALLSLQWFSWVLSFQWLYDYYLEIGLSEVVKHYNIKKIGCIHEMHSFSRVVWRVASRHKAAGYTVQHAAVTVGKRWYFPYPEEIESGLVFPDLMYVYNKKVIETLNPYYKNTRFVLGCSARYSHWKDVKATRSNKGSYCLVASALAGFDNETLITLLRRLLDTTEGKIPIRLRLHPYAMISAKGKCWVRSNVKKGVIEISRVTSLRTDIEDAIGVIGMSTTVLEEALLLGRPVIQLTHPDYLQYIDLDGVQGVKKKDYRDISVGDLLDLSNMHIDLEEMRERLGLNQPVVTYKRLFAEDMMSR